MCGWVPPQEFKPFLHPATEYFFATYEWPDSTARSHVLHRPMIRDLIGDADPPDSLPGLGRLRRLSARAILDRYEIWPTRSQWCADPAREMSRLREWARREPLIAGAAPFAINLYQMEEQWRMVQC